MSHKRKISGDANGPVVVVLSTAISHPKPHQRETMVGVGVRLQARRELLHQMAPHYRAAPSTQKRELLDTFTQITGYHRKYAMWLLNHTEDGQTPPSHAHPRCYGPEVQEALVVAWNAANRICAKNLIPFLPTFVETLEHHGYLHLSDACREHLLTMSSATADRLLRASRVQGRHGLSTTRAGTLLKQQIPIRTFQQWNETQPGFLEVDVVAHCEADVKGDYVSSLTLTDVATGWTECLPLLYKSQETVLEALQQARTLFPFPILGLDTDNGGEFINEVLLSYCEAEQITFTRGRPSLKNDQCYIEQKNGAIVRQVVGHDRFVGVLACQQLGELYRALRLYVNCFQPSMKLQGKYYDGRKVRLVYDRAKTPLQRLLLSGVLPASKEQELKEMFQALDPVRLFEQVKALQQALFIHSTRASPRFTETGDIPLRRFCVEACTIGSPASDVPALKMACQQHEKTDELPSTSSLVEWHRTRNDPFKEVWELIASWVLVHPERTSGEILRELQGLFPERYQPSHLRTLQRGLRKIRARLRTMVVVQWQKDVIQAEGRDLASPSQKVQEASNTDVALRAVAFLPTHDPSQQQTRDPLPPQRAIEEETLPPLGTATSAGGPQTSPSHPEPSTPPLPSHPSTRHTSSGQRRSSLPIKQAIHHYLEAQRKGKRQPKTLEWHQTALHLFQQYLQNECQCLLINQITETKGRGWLTFLRETPTTRGMLRSAGTIQSYTRSVRAFCQWLVRQRYLHQTPFAQQLLPDMGPSLPCLLEQKEWERLLQVCHPFHGKVVLAEQTAMRNRALLWVLFETGMRPAELCGLRLSDVDREQGLLRVKGKGSGSKQRWVPLKEGLSALLRYVDQFRFVTVACEKQKRGGGEPLFLSEWGRPLTENGIALLFGRLRKRAGITRTGVNPSLLRDSFAVRYLQAGGDLHVLRELLGHEESVRVKRSLRIREEAMENQMQ